MTSKEEALGEAEDTKRKVVEWKASYEATIERLTTEKARLSEQVRKQAETLESLTEKLAQYRDYEALAGVVDRIIETRMKASGNLSGAGTIDLKKLASELLPKVLEKIPASGSIQYVPAPPRTVILKSFMDTEVARLEERLKTLSIEAKKVIAYLQARGTNSTKRDLIIHVFGPSSASGAGYTRVSKLIDEALATELIREDRAGRLYPNLKQKVEADLKAYEASKEDMDAVAERMMYLIAQGEARALAIAS
ncbi:MAG: hypothetical protein JRN45_00715 [Nitrososphaerota archaeon]|nr:hypothetical protein [Nitrososphaerota archaeon]